jgi:hypothetical protein
MARQDLARGAERFAGQASRLNEIDPYYWFEFGVEAEMVTVTAHPRYPDEDFMRFGTPATIPSASITRLAVDAPAGLGGEFQGGTLTLDGTFPPGAEQAVAVLLRVPVQPPVRQTIRLNVTSRSTGPAGGLRLFSQDPSGLLTLDQRFDMLRRTHQAKLTYRYHTAVLPRMPSRSCGSAPR